MIEQYYWTQEKIDHKKRSDSHIDKLMEEGRRLEKKHGLVGIRDIGEKKKKRKLK